MQGTIGRRRRTQKAFDQIEKKQKKPPHMDDSPTFKKRVEVASGPHESPNIKTKGVEVETAPKIWGVKGTDRMHETNTTIQSKQKTVTFGRQKGDPDLQEKHRSAERKA